MAKSATSGRAGRRVAIIGGLRTPFVKANTVFNELSALDLAVLVVKELMSARLDRSFPGSPPPASRVRSC
jgi:acetyl-CoA acetyltransferase